MVNKKKILKATKEESSYFVSLKNPLELRRHLLESSRKSVYTLQSYQRIILLRERKAKELAAFKQSLKELLYLDKKLNEKLPAIDDELLKSPKKVREDAPKKRIEKQKVEQKPDSKAPVKVPVVKEKTDLEKLEESLNNIEQKLQKLDAK